VKEQTILDLFISDIRRKSRFPHWSLRWMFWLFFFLTPTPLILNLIFELVYPKTMFWMVAYFGAILLFLIGVATTNSIRYNRKINRVSKDEPYEQRYYTAVGTMIPIGGFILYFTYYLCMIPFTYQPNYVFTLKPSKQLEMEMNDLLGADTLGYTPYDYLLDTQEVTYVTDGVSSMRMGMIGGFIRRDEGYVKFERDDLDYLKAIEKQEAFKLTILNGKCYLYAEVDRFEPRVINHPKFKLPIEIRSGPRGGMLVDTLGVYYERQRECVQSDHFSQNEWDSAKYLALQANIQYPYIYKEVISYKKALRRIYNFTLNHFDSRISDF